MVEIKWTDTDPETGQRRYLCVHRFAGQWWFKFKLQRRGEWNREIADPHANDPIDDLEGKTVLVVGHGSIGRALAARFDSARFDSRLANYAIGWIRWHSGSTALTILLHMLVNLGATTEAILKVGWSAT